MSALVIGAACSQSEAPEPSAEAPAVQAPEVEMAEFGEGEAIAETLCAVCHAVGAEGDSPHVDAKPFREFSENYPVSALEEALVEGIVVGHPDMPVWQFEPREVEALVDYIESVQDPKDT